MGEILGIGCTHAPHLQFTDGAMANVLRRTMRSERTPEPLRDPRNWPAPMQAELGEDEGLSAARRHRVELLAGFRAARAALDAFQPDFVLIWGDDQYENFQVDVLPAFCVYALDEFTIAPFKASNGLGASANVWNAPTDLVVPVRGHQQAANHLAHALIESGFDVACAYRMHHSPTLGHAHTRTILYLDYDQRGFDYPVIPFHVNCYGSNLRVPPADRPGATDVPVRPPPSPPPWRCYDLGKRVAEIIAASPWRAAVIGSSSWSHGTLTAKHHYLYPDVEADRRRYAELEAGEFHRWRDLDARDVQASGQHEMLNWICLAGAMEGRRAEPASFVQSYLFNSNKVLALFPAASREPALAGEVSVS
ncbi:MAG TPA: extradiol ring-cleavage dioxygenase [Chloroflexota bacterium]|jgi:hypothetical protein